MIIRKISVGPNFKDSMNYCVGQYVSTVKSTICDITRQGNEFTIWVKNSEGEKMSWKVISNMPVVFENDLSFAQ